MKVKLMALNLRRRFKAKIVCIFKTIHFLIQFNISVCYVVEQVLTATYSLAQNCKFEVSHLGCYIEQILTGCIDPYLVISSYRVETGKVSSLG